MSMNIRDQARRFITLVDELYNARVLLVSARCCVWMASSGQSAAQQLATRHRAHNVQYVDAGYS
jgi:predicted ATPase